MKERHEIPFSNRLQEYSQHLLSGSGLLSKHRDDTERAATAGASHNTEESKAKALVNTN